MKQLTCEMCGSTDLIKQDGVFVCQSCGIKYSVEEAKKMMIEGTVEVQGTVQIDNSNMIEQWMTMAQTAENVGNCAEAYDYYTKVIEQDPTNWRAIWGKGRAAAWQSSMRNDRTPELYQALRLVLPLIVNESDETQCVLRNEFCMEIVRVNNAIVELFDDSIPEWGKRYECHKELFEETLQRHYDNIKLLQNAMSLIEDYTDDESVENVIFIKKRICKDIKVVCDHTYSYTYYSSGYELYGHVYSSYDKKDECEALFEDLMFELCQYDPLFGTNHEDLPCYPLEELKTSNDKVVYWRKRYTDRKQRYDKAIKELALKKYWAEHAEEKRNFDNRLDEIKRALQPLTEQRDALNKKKTSLNNKKNEKVPAEKEAYSVSLKIDSLKKEFASLGIFSGKRKKEIQAELESLNTERENLERLSREQRTQMQNDIQEEIRKIDAELAPIKEQIESLKAEEKTITDELTKDR